MYLIIVLIHTFHHVPHYIISSSCKTGVERAVQKLDCAVDKKVDISEVHLYI